MSIGEQERPTVDARPGLPGLTGLSAEEALTRVGVLGSISNDGESGRIGNDAGIRYRLDNHVLYGIVDVEEGSFGGSGLPLQRAAEDAYRRIFALIERERRPHLWRTWNYLADINKETGGLERYRQFNIGRHDAFVAGGRLTRGNVPAACALGTHSGPLTIAFMAGRTEAVPLENPRQVSAYDYPAAYGPRSPTFSRAALAYLPGRELLFISGTASILGHRTLHRDDITGQTREIVANLAAMLASANAEARTVDYTLGELRLRAYVRHVADQAVVHRTLEQAIGTGLSIEYVQADICRADLLVEIEANASHAMGNC
jgi:enamine deaminase RidA (YjgF/YER057c/UK114 family)